MKNKYKYLAVVPLAFCLAAQDQDPAPQPPSSGGWRRVGDQRPPQGPPPPPRQDAPAPPSYAPPPAVAPSQLVLAAGTWLTVRMDQAISSDRNQSGDTFTATLVEPLVADGFIVARRGQTISGRVAEAVKAGRVKGTSRLALEITEIGLVDGRPLPVRTQLMEYAGGTSVGRDATAVGATTGVGAAIGGAAAGGMGAGIGAAAGAAASTIGVLVTRGRETVVYPEAAVRFRTLAPITISTERSGHAFQPVRQGDFEPRGPQLQRRVALQPRPYYAPYPYPYSPYFYGPSFYFYSGPRFYGRGFGRRW